MFVICSVHPLSFIRNASARRATGIRSNPDSAIVRTVPPFASASSNSTSVVGSGVDGVRMPAVREIALGLDPIDHDLQRQVLVPWRRDLAADGRAFGER